MPLTDIDRIDAHARAPRLVALWQALAPLGSCLSFMNSGAHPDDEHSDLLAALAFREGLSLAYVCSTRGEGGQNDIGNETGWDLGTLRTAEMERAAAVLGLRLYWLDTEPGDPVHDFGFSKSGTDTLGRWGHARLVERLVAAIRAERPDILCPTFLDVPGQHGHHRAMTQAAQEAVPLAADAAFAAPGAPWAVGKLLLPAWSGAGDAYDDDLPPPPATFTVAGAGSDPVTGWTWAQIGEQSRAFHRTQGMGRWMPPGRSRDWPLHLVSATVPGAAEGLTAGLPATLAEAARAAGADALVPDLDTVDRACAEARAAFPRAEAVAQAAAHALAALRPAIAACREAARPHLLHRLDRRAAQLARVIRLAAGGWGRAALVRDWLRPGERVAVSVEAQGAVARLLWPEGWDAEGDGVTVPPDAAPTDPYPARFDPLSPRHPALALTVRVDGVEVTDVVPLEVEPVVLPAVSATLEPARVALNRLAPPAPLAVAVGDVSPAGAATALAIPADWTAEAMAGGFSVTVPAQAAPGLHHLALRVAGAQAMRERRLGYGHTGPRARPEPATVAVRVLDAALPAARVAYIGAGHDRVDARLRAIGLDVTTLGPGLPDATALAAFDTLVIGLFAFRFRAGLAALTPTLRGWVEAGGNLVTLYHRPWDGWDPDTTPPRRLEIGKPSLRWRVTDAAAAVTHLEPDHPLLNTPNRIGPEDWEAWVKERGLYFARAWDEAYRPLLSMADPGEAPLTGALLSGRIGRGRHTHVALGLHTQMEALVPGAYRLMANLVAPA